jgi:hypothetical protein
MAAHSPFTRSEGNSMSLSPEVKAAVDEIHRDRDLIASMKAADKVRDQQLADIQAKLDAATNHMSDEDRQALIDAVSDARDANPALSSAVTANVDGSPSGEPASAPAASQPAADPSVIAGPSTADGGPAAPLMPTSAFDPGAGTRAAPADAWPAAAAPGH